MPIRRLATKLKSVALDHALRHKPSGFQFTIAEGIDQLRADHWDALVDGQGVCLGRPFLGVLEQAGPANLASHYAIVYREGAPVAAVACQSVALDGSMLPSRTAGGRRVALRDRGLARLTQRVLVCGNLLGWGPQGVAFANGQATAERWCGVAEALYRIRRGNVLFGQTDLVLVKDLGAAEAHADGPLRRFSYRAIETEPNMILTLRPEWRTFDDYLAALRSDYRSNIRKLVREVTAAGLTPRRLDTAGVHRHAEDLHRLYLEVHERQKLRLVTLAPRFLPALAAEFGGDLRTVVLERAEGGLAGFVTMLKDRDGAIGYYIGFDKATAARGVPLYLRLLYALVEEAVDARATWLSLGRTALEPKASLGAVGHPLRCYVRHRLPALNAFVRALVYAAPEPDQSPERKPFKPPKAISQK